MYLPFIGAFLEAVGMVFEKTILRKKSLNYKTYTVYAFLAIVVLMLPFLWFFWDVRPGAFSLFPLLIFIAIIGVSILSNLLIFYSLQREKLSEFEPIWLMQPLFTVALAFLFFAGERNILTLGLAFIASITLVLSHVKKYHFSFDKYNQAALLGSFLFALELVLSRFILDYYSPFTFYFIRCLCIFVVTFALFRPKGSVFIRDKKLGLMVLFVAVLWILYRVIIYYGYLSSGIVFTTSVFILSPVFLFLFAVVFLKEKPTFRQIASAIIIVLCVALLFVFGGSS